MNLKKLLEDVKNNNLNIDDALEKLKDLPYEDIGYAHIDHHRNIRNGYPEVIYCKGKSDEHILGIIEKMNEKGSNILGTRCEKTTFDKISKVYPHAKYDLLSKILRIENEEIYLELDVKKLLLIKFQKYILMQNMIYYLKY